MEWVSVDEELPKNETVLVSDEEGRMMVGAHEIKHHGPCWRIGHEEISWDYDYNLDYQVSCWARINPPE